MVPGQWHPCPERPDSVPYDPSKSKARNASRKRSRDEPDDSQQGQASEGAASLSKTARRALRKVSALIAAQPALSAFLASNPR